MILILIFAEALALYGLIGKWYMSIEGRMILAKKESVMGPRCVQEILMCPTPHAVGIILASKAGQSTTAA